MSEYGRVRVVNRKDPSHRIQFPARQNAERWLVNHDPKLWDIVPIDEADDEPGILKSVFGEPVTSSDTN